MLLTGRYQLLNKLIKQFFKPYANYCYRCDPHIIIVIIIISNKNNNKVLIITIIIIISFVRMR